LVGGSIWHFIGGIRNAPRGHRISQAISRVQVRVPITAGAFAVWGTLFSCFDCTITSIRKKEDPWNAILSGACTGGVLAARAGLKSMGTNALLGGVILAAMEGVGIAFQRVVMPWIERRYLAQANPGMVDMLNPPIDPLRPRNYSRAYNPPSLMQMAASDSGSASKEPEKSWKLW
jgi:mitochondrial import inner membrane translocase subunit TIM17